MATEQPTHPYPVTQDAPGGPKWDLRHFYRGCRCEGCVKSWREERRETHARRWATDEAYRERVKAANRRNREKANRVASRDEHLRPSLAVGNSGYACGCRCAGCVAGHNAYQRLRRGKGDARSKHNEQERERYYRRTPDRQRRAREAQKEHNSRRAAWLSGVKLANGCADCGYRGHFAALDFDHVRGEKLFDIGPGAKRAKAAVEAEIAKCDVVCARCHRLRSAARLAATGPGRCRPRKQPDLFEPQWAQRKRARQRELLNEKRAKGRAFLDALKLTAGCAGCGYREHACALDFDHVRGEKRFHVSVLKHLSPEARAAEIAKCEVVCANCHRVRTWERKCGKPA